MPRPALPRPAPSRCTPNSPSSPAPPCRWDPRGRHRPSLVLPLGARDVPARAARGRRRAPSRDAGNGTSTRAGPRGLHRLPVGVHRGRGPPGGRRGADAQRLPGPRRPAALHGCARLLANLRRLPRHRRRHRAHRHDRHPQLRARRRERALPGRAGRRGQRALRAAARRRRGRGRAQRRVAAADDRRRAGRRGPLRGAARAGPVPATAAGGVGDPAAGPARGRAGHPRRRLVLFGAAPGRRRGRAGHLRLRQRSALPRRRRPADRPGGDGAALGRPGRAHPQRPRRGGPVGRARHQLLQRRRRQRAVHTRPARAAGGRGRLDGRAPAAPGGGTPRRATDRLRQPPRHAPRGRRAAGGPGRAGDQLPAGRGSRARPARAGLARPAHRPRPPRDLLRRVGRLPSRHPPRPHGRALPGRRPLQDRQRRPWSRRGATSCCGT